jgi:hypothetical protein
LADPVPAAPNRFRVSQSAVGGQNLMVQQNQQANSTPQRTLQERLRLASPGA